MKTGTPENRKPLETEDSVSLKFLSSNLNVPSKPKILLNQIFSSVQNVFGLEGFHCIWKTGKLQNNKLHCVKYHTKLPYFIIKLWMGFVYAWNINKTIKYVAKITMLFNVLFW